MTQVCLPVLPGFFYIFLCCENSHFSLLFVFWNFSNFLKMSIFSYAETLAEVELIMWGTVEHEVPKTT